LRRAHRRGNTDDVPFQVDPSVVGPGFMGYESVCPGRVVVDHVVSVTKSGERDRLDLYSVQYVARADVPAWALGKAIVAEFRGFNFQPGSSATQGATISSYKGRDVRVHAR
jgi:hypothetical protein